MKAKDIAIKYEKMRPGLECVRKELMIRIESLLEDESSLNVDYIKSRVKETERFVEKSTKRDSDNKLKYCYPFNEIQDALGFRIILLYSAQIQRVTTLLEQEFNFLEDEKREKEKNEFGYEAHHLICFIPKDLQTNGYLQKYDSELEFFEIQIATIFQHAWNETTHDILYKKKDRTEISREDERTFAFVAAQAWAADKLIDDFKKRK